MEITRRRPFSQTEIAGKQPNALTQLFEANFPDRVPVALAQQPPQSFKKRQ